MSFLFIFEINANIFKNIPFNQFIYWIYGGIENLHLIERERKRRESKEIKATVNVLISAWNTNDNYEDINYGKLYLIKLLLYYGFYSLYDFPVI